jgi:hypothetical protein
MAPDVRIGAIGATEAKVFGDEVSSTCALDEGKGGSSPAKLAVATFTTVALMSGEEQ